VIGAFGALIEALSPTPIEVDALIASTGLQVATIQTLLFELDLAGRLEWSTGQLVALRG
jgi:DNA processing protein